MINKADVKITFNVELMTLRSDSGSVELSEYSTKCLMLLLDNEGSLVLKEKIIEVCWGRKNIFVSDASLRQLVTQLRKSLTLLGAEDDILVTMRGKGYLLEADHIIIEKTPLESRKKYYDKYDIQQPLIQIETSPKDGTILHNPEKTNKIKKPLNYKISNIFLVLTISFSFLASGIILNFKLNDVINRVSYEYLDEINGRHYYVQSDTSVPDHPEAELTKFDKLNLYKTDLYPYVYLNHSDYIYNSSAFLCKHPMGSSDAECISLIIMGKKK